MACQSGIPRSWRQLVGAARQPGRRTPARPPDPGPAAGPRPGRRTRPGPAVGPGPGAGHSALLPVSFKVAGKNGERRGQGSVSRCPDLDGSGLTGCELRKRQLDRMALQMGRWMRYLRAAWRVFRESTCAPTLVTQCGGPQAMAKALLGHVGGPDPRMASEVRRLQRRVCDLEAELARLQEVNDVLAAGVGHEMLLDDREPVLT